MKTYALCLSGDPRYIKESIESIKKNIINVNDIDIFGHFWIRSKDTKSYLTLRDCVTNDYIEYMSDHCMEFIDKIKETINFTEIHCEEHPEFENLFFPTDVSDIKDITRHNIFVQSQYLSVYKANKLKKDCEIVNGKEYKMVVRLRPDILIDNCIKLDEYQEDKVYATLMPSENPDDMYMYDQMCIGNSKNMDIFSNYYYCMKEVYDVDGFNGICAQELHIPYYLKTKGITLTNNTFGQKFLIVRNIVRMAR